MSQFQSPKSPWPPQPGQFGTEQQYSQWQQQPQQPISNLQWQPPSQPLPPQQWQQPQQPYPVQFPPQQWQWQQHSQLLPPQQQPPMIPIQPAPQPKRRFKKRWIALGVIVLIVIIAAASGSHGSSPTATTSIPTAQATTQPTTQATAKPTSKPTQAPFTPTPAHTFLTFSDGIFQVGKDIQPGTYRTRVGSTNCYYARLKDFDTTAIISNNNTDAPAVVTIAATDKAFQSQNCGTWTNDLSAITSSKTSFGDGIYIVGTDITPGTYKNTASTNCYYARLSAFDTFSIISNNNTDAVAIVTIAASDKGFQSQNCGTWTKL